MLWLRAVHVLITVLAAIPGSVASYVGQFSENQKVLFDYTLTGLDANFGPPFLVHVASFPHYFDLF